MKKMKQNWQNWKVLNQRKKGSILGGILGFTFWMLSVDFAIGISMIPVAVILGLVMLPYIVGMFITTTFFSGVGYLMGVWSEKLGAKQGIAAGAVALLAIVGLFAVLMVNPSIDPNLPPATAQAVQQQYAMKPFETMATVSKLANEPGNVFIGYTSGNRVGAYQTSCPSGCIYGCLPSGTCKPIPLDR